MATQSKKTTAKHTDAETVLHDYKPALVGVVGDKYQLLLDSLKELRAARKLESSLRKEVERLTAQAAVDGEVITQLHHALFQLREWHKDEYQSSRRIDTQADAALALFSPAMRDQKRAAGRTQRSRPARSTTT